MDLRKEHSSVASSLNTHSKAPEEPALGDLLKRLHADLVALADTEKELAKTEMALKWKEAKMQAAAFVAIAILALLATLCLTASAVLGLSTVMNPWLAALLVGGVLLGVSAIAFLKLRALFRTSSPLPERAIHNVRQDIEAVEEAVQ